MKRIFIFAALMMSLDVVAQETYESAQLATEDLNGTSRYVGMGGAMEALGADISTMHTNPAGVGMFRKSWIGATAGATIQQGNNNVNNIFNKTGVTNADLDQVGFVYAGNTRKGNNINFGFNFKKNRNFNEILTATNSLYNGSASTKSAIGKVLGRYNYSDYLVNEVFNSQFDTQDAAYALADSYAFSSINSGYIGEYAFNISGSINNRVYLGVGIGIKSVHYKSDSEYIETLLDESDNYRGDLSIADWRKITGTGVDVKFGAIFRPVESSPFRIGLYINTPTWYRLTCTSEQRASFYVSPGNDVDNQTGKTLVDDTYGNSATWDYNVNTPWKFGVSLGHTIANMFAIGLTYQYSDYSAIDNRIASIDTYDYYDGWGWGYTESYRSSYSDNMMNRNTENSLKGVSLLKLGVEAKPVPEVAIRLGYNYQSAIYDKSKGTKETTLDTDGSYLATNSYTNWGDTHRITFGLGFKLDTNLNLDLSYQYSTTKGDYYPFEKMNETSSTVANIPVATTVKDNRHQLSATLGYRF